MTTPGLAQAQGSSQAWSAMAYQAEKALNTGWVLDQRVDGSGGFIVNCSPTSSGYIFTSSGDGTTGSGNGLYTLGRAVRITQGTSTTYGWVASASVAASVTTVGLSSGSATVALSSATALASVAVGAQSGTATLSASTSPSATARFHREDGSWANVSEAGLSLSDVTTVNVSTSAHGFTPKSPNDTSLFLRGDGTWATPTTTQNLKETLYGTEVAAAETTTSTSFVELSTSQAVTTATATLNDKVVGWWGGGWKNSGSANGYCALSIDGSSPGGVDGSMTTSAGYESGAYVKAASGLSAATHTLTPKFATDSGGTLTAIYRKFYAQRTGNV